MPEVSMNITLQSEYRGDHWACRSPQLGFTVYGKTRADAEHEVNHAVGALLHSFHGDLDGIIRYLTRYEVDHSIDADPGSKVTDSDGQTRLVRIEVPIAA